MFHAPRFHVLCWGVKDGFQDAELVDIMLRTMQGEELSLAEFEP